MDAEERYTAAKRELAEIEKVLDDALGGAREGLSLVGKARYLVAVVSDPQAVLERFARQDGLERWCVHLQGPDSMLPTYSKREAEERAAKINATLAKMFPEGALICAVVAKWPFSAEAHRPGEVDWNGDLC